MSAASSPDVSVVVVSYNTRDLLRHCLQTLKREASDVIYETLVVDNASRDDSADMVQHEFPEVKLIRSPINLGFAAANNRAFHLAQGRYLVLLNSDAFIRPGALSKAVEHMEKNPNVGLGGGRLVGRDDSWQPSARMFPSALNDFLTLSGLAAKFPQWRFFGRVDRTWADPLQASEVDWVPGAFSIIRHQVLEEIGYFDEAFFLYYEEVDLCRRIKAAGYSVWYWPDIVVVHLGGESAKTVKHISMSADGSQLTLWRMRSALLYYRKHHGMTGAWLARSIEMGWHTLRAWKNAGVADANGRAKTEESKALLSLMRRAWRETRGGARRRRVLGRVVLRSRVQDDTASAGRCGVVELLLSAINTRIVARHPWCNGVGQLQALKRLHERGIGSHGNDARHGGRRVYRL